MNISIQGPKPVPRSPYSGGGSTPKPLFFIHIPKTAGGSLITIFQNLFSEARVIRLRNCDDLQPHSVQKFISDNKGRFDCLIGHVPIHAIGDHRHSFRIFTMLRDPVERVLSLFRFLKSMPANAIAHQRLETNFGLEDLLESRVPENYAQTHNLMCRMLCGDPTAMDPSAPGFWIPENAPGLIQRSLVNLRNMDFGLVEHMSSTLALLEDAYGLDFCLQEHLINATGKSRAEIDLHIVYKIVQQNIDDIVFYRQASQIFHARVKELVTHGVETERSPARLHRLQVQAGLEVGASEIPSRQGFYECDPGGLMWLAANQTGTIAFETSLRCLRLRFELYRVSERFPVEEITIGINGIALKHKATHVEGLFVFLQTESFHPKKGINVLTLDAPYAIPVRFIKPSSEDHRSLSVALVKLIFDSHERR